MAKKKLTVDEVGKRGGNATLKKYGPDYYKKLSKLGVKARRKKHHDSTDKKHK